MRIKEPYYVVLPQMTRKQACLLANFALHVAGLDGVFVQNARNPVEFLKSEIEEKEVYKP